MVLALHQCREGMGRASGSTREFQLWHGLRWWEPCFPVVVVFFHEATGSGTAHFRCGSMGTVSSQARPPSCEFWFCRALRATLQWLNCRPHRLRLAGPGPRDTGSHSWWLQLEVTRGSAKGPGHGFLPCSTRHLEKLVIKEKKRG